MSLIPAFEIGVWNAWIPMLYLLLLTPLMMMINKGTSRDKIREQPSGARESQFTDSYNKTQKRTLLFWHVVYFLAYIYSIFLPLQLGTSWFYIGLPISMVGVITFTMVIVTFATTPIDSEPLTRGLYRYSRHPMYVTQALMFIGVSIACASWVFLLFTIVYAILSIIGVSSEEQGCLEKYGDAYREYMNRTPRWLGIPK